MKWLVADWDANKSHVFDRVTSSLKSLGHTCTHISRADKERRADLVAAIRSGEYDILLTWQRFYRMQRDILSAIEDSGIRTLFMDFGFVPHYQTVVFDTAGENAASSWLDHWKTGGPPDLTPDDLQRAEELIVAEAARARTFSAPAVGGIDLIRAPFIFVPLQRPRDAVVRHDSTVHDFRQFLQHILFLARGRYFVVCKTHPLDRDLDLGVPDRIEGQHLIIRESFGAVNEEVCEYLLSRASLVVGVNSNMTFRALTFGTPVTAAGRGWYSGSGALTEVDGIKGLTELCADIPPFPVQRKYVATCLSRQIHMNDLARPEKIAAMLERLGVDAGVPA